MLTRLALRNIFRNRRRSAITVAVIVFGVLGLILFGGYKAVTFKNLRESTIRGRLGHIQIYQLGYTSSKSQQPLEYGLEDVSGLRMEVERDPRRRGQTGQVLGGEPRRERLPALCSAHHAAVAIEDDRGAEAELNS